MTFYKIRVRPCKSAVKDSPAKSRYDCRHARLISAIRLTKARLQLAIFHADHDRSGDNGEHRQHIQRDQACTDTPAKELAKVPEVNRMPHARTDAGGDQLLTMFARFKLGQARDLRVMEARNAAE